MNLRWLLSTLQSQPIKEPKANRTIYTTTDAGGLHPLWNPKKKQRRTSKMLQRHGEDFYLYLMSMLDRYSASCILAVISIESTSSTLLFKLSAL